MRSYLRLLGGVLLFGGLATFAMAAMLAIRDVTFFQAGEALARHPDHVLFQGEYYAALLRHIAYIVTAIIGGLWGRSGARSSSACTRSLVRLEHLEAAATAPRAL